MRVIYLVQGDGSTPLYDFPERSDYLYLQWQPDYRPMENSFHFPRSSWASGRNELYRRARIKGSYDYYVLMDDDLSFDLDVHGAKVRKEIRRRVRKLRWPSAWRLGRSYIRGTRSPPTLLAFEELLKASGSLVGAPRLWGHSWNGDFTFQDVDAVAYVDPCMVAIHTSVADTLLPYSTDFDDVNWWTCGELFCERAIKSYWGRVHRFSNFHIWNTQNRDYPREGRLRTRLQNLVGKAVCEPLPELSATSTLTPALRDDSAVVVTSIAASTDALRGIGARSRHSDLAFVVVGDEKTPSDFQIEGCDYWSLSRQTESPFQLAERLPKNSYSRKNLGYLIALANPRIQFIIETDDDNAPLEAFWAPRTTEHDVESLAGSGWVNIYRRFTDQTVWPRGFPLEHIGVHPKCSAGPTQYESSLEQFPSTEGRRTCLVQQGLVQHDPDVDAIFRLTRPLPVWFGERKPIYLEPGLWCPTNSQNTTWSVDVVELMYLPSHCSMRQIDVWRGLLAQRVLWTFGAGVMFHQATVLQIRNAHDLQQDFARK